MLRLVVWLAVLRVVVVSSIGEGERPGGLKDLGILSPNTMIPLDKNTDRADFSHFVVEVSPSYDTNHLVRFTTTNSFLQLSDMTALPSGRMLLGVKTVATDGTESSVSVFTFTIWRSEKLPSPKAGTVVRRRKATNEFEGPDSLPRAFGRLKASSTQSRVTVPPPLPPGLTPVQSFSVPVQPLPNGTNETYAELLDRQAEKAMQSFYKHNGRRNE